jgi:predicted Zn-dependent protease
LFQEAIQAEPGRLELVDDLARLEIQRGRLDEAVRLLRHRWRSGPPEAETADRLAIALTDLGYHDEGQAWLTLASGLGAGAGPSRWSEAVVAYRNGHLEQAERALLPLLAEPDPGAHVVSLAAVVMAKRRGADAALPALAAAAATLPDANNVRSLLADVYRAAGRTADEQRERARVLEICQRGVVDAPESPLWPRCLASQMALAGDVDSAVSWYDRAVTLGWRKLAADRVDGWLDLASGDARFQATQVRMGEDLARMRAIVARDGVPVATLAHSVQTRRRSPF